LQIRRQGTIAHIPENESKSIYTICNCLYSHKPFPKIKGNEIYNFIGPSGLEDIFAIYLQHKHGYYVLPSTDKIATEKYECALIDPNDGKIIYFQAKNGKIPLKIDEYKEQIKDSTKEI
jgi:hypothetical protein